MKKTTRNIIIAAAVVAVLVGVFFLVQLIPSSDSGSTGATYPTDENGEQYATDAKGNKIPSEKDKDGNIISAGVVELENKGPLKLKKIDVENKSGTFTILAETPTTKSSSDTDATETSSTKYTLVGFEKEALLSGQPEAVANDASNMTTTQIIDITGKNPEEYGLDKPRAVVTATFDDGSKSTYKVGNAAPADLGSYLQFGDDKAIYLVANDSVDSFLFSPLDLISKEITAAAQDEDNSEIKTLTLTGANFPDKIVMVPNDDETNDATYKMTAPKEQPVNETNGSSVTGAIRGLSADKVVAVNPSDKQLKTYGLDKPAAALEAVYPDETIRLTASKEDGDGNVYLMVSGKDTVYQIAASKVPWATTDYDSLVYEYVSRPKLDFISSVDLSASGKNYTFKVTKEEKKDETTGSTTTEYGVTCGKTKVKSSYFETFFDNLTNVQRDSSAGKLTASGKPLLTITYHYNNGKSEDTLKFYDAGNRKILVEVNGSADCVIYETYTNKIISDLPLIAAGKHVDPM